MKDLLMFPASTRDMKITVGGSQRKATREAGEAGGQRTGAIGT